MLQDKWLALRCRRGDREAFSLIYETYVDDLLTLAVHLLGDVGSAEDVVQDVFVGFARNAASFRLTGSLKGYLATCTANRARDVIRHRQRLQPAALPDADALDSGVHGRPTRPSKRNSKSNCGRPWRRCRMNSERPLSCGCTGI